MPSADVNPINLGSHRSKAVRRTIRKAGAKLFFLPKYSPDLNPIEQLFSKLKHWLQSAIGHTKDVVCNAIGRILDAVSATQCSNYLKNTRYDKT